MSEQNNENEVKAEQIQGVLEEVNRRLRKNLELLESLRKVREVLETILEEARARKAESEPKADGKNGDSTEEKREIDPLYTDAVKLFRKEKRMSVSLLQRRFSIGYGRGKKLLETMAAEGVFDAMPIGGRTPRGIIVKPDDPEE